MPDVFQVLAPTAAKMAKITRRLKWVATLVPLALMAMVSVDGISPTDIGVIAFITAVLWLFVGIAAFAVSALAQAEKPEHQ